MTFSHEQLVERAARWLRGTGDCYVVATELQGSLEVADAIGWTLRHSILIECKTTVADFRADRHKRTRRNPDFGVGNLRYYMAPPEVIPPAELPDQWGLLEVYPGIVRRVKLAQKFDYPRLADLERVMLVRLALRLTLEE